MVSLIIFLIGTLLTGVFVAKKWSQIKTASRTGVGALLLELKMPIIYMLLTIVISFINPYKVERVDASYVGFKINLTGEERGISKYQYKTGWVVYNTWSEQFVEIPIKQFHAGYDEQLVTFKGGFTATVTPTFNYKVKPEFAAAMYVELRAPLNQIVEGWLQNAVVSAIYNVSNRWTIDSVFNYRELFEIEIKKACNEHTSAYFDISQLRTKIPAPPSLQSAIINKTKAIQDVQAAKMQKEVAEAQAYEKIARAKGDSAEVVIKAAGQAEAARRIQERLSPIYVDYLKVNKWDGVNPNTVLGSSNTSVIVK